MAAALFLALCAWVGAFLFRRLDAPAPSSAAPTAAPLRLEGLVLRQEQPLSAPLAAESGARLSDRETGGLGPGLYLESLDGFEHLSPALLDGLDAAGLRALLDERPRRDRSARAKLIRGFAWYYAALADGAPELSPGPCRLRFAGMERSAPARLLDVRTGEGESLLLLRLTEDGAAFARLRKCAAELDPP